jgi:virulence-associated protein VapD
MMVAPANWSANLEERYQEGGNVETWGYAHGDSARSLHQHRFSRLQGCVSTVEGIVRRQRRVSATRFDMVRTLGTE